MQKVTIRSFLSNAAKKKYRTEMLDGIKYLVVPTVMITVGIHNGSDGPIFYGEEDLANSTIAWNNKPVVVFHPKKGKKGVSTAADPKVLEMSRVGFVLNTGWDTAVKKLRTEAWIDEVKADRVDPRIVKAIKNGTPMEVSTGLRAEVIENEGTHNGTAYKKVAKNHQPDHLALLPEGVGACSIAAGAGLLVTNSDGGWDGDPDEVSELSGQIFDQIMNSVSERMMELVVNGLSYTEVSTLVRDALRAKFGEPGRSWYGYIVDLYESSVVYSTDGGGMWSVGYSISGNAATIEGSPVPVRPVQKYADVKTGKMVANSIPSETDMALDRNKHIATLIANGEWTEADRPELEKMPDSVLERIKPKAIVTPPVATPPAPAPVVTNETKPAEPTLEEYLKTVPESIRPLIVNGLNAEAARRKGFIELIGNSPSNKMSPEVLVTLKTEVLEGMAALVTKPAVNDEYGLSAEAISFFGAQGAPPSVTLNAKGDEPPVLLAPGAKKAKVS